MEDYDIDSLHEVVSSVFPYLNFPDDLENLADELYEKNSSYEDFEKEFVSIVSEEEDPTRKADFRIFLNKLRKVD